MTNPNTIFLESLGFGAVQAGATTPAPIIPEALVLNLGTVMVDPTRPSSPLRCQITDADSGAIELGELYGPQAAKEAGRLARSHGTGASAEVPYQPDDETVTALRQLGTLRWLRTNSPLPLDRRLLRMEELTLAASLGSRMEEAPPLRELAEICAFVGEHLDGQADGLVSRLLGDALEQVSAWASAASGLGEWAQERLARLEVASPPMPAPTLEEKTLELLRRPAALFAGETLYVGTANVDWDAVPTGWVSTKEDSAEWWLELGDDWVKCGVVVPASAPVNWFGGIAWSGQPDAEDRLAVDLSLPGWPVPIMAGELAFDPGAQRWTGGASGDANQARIVAERIDAGERLRVRFWHHEPSKTPAEMAAALRWAARGLSAARLGAAGQPEPRDTAVAAWREAAQAWDMAQAPQRAAVCAELADACAADRWGAGVVLSVAEEWFLRTR